MSSTDLEKMVEQLSGLTVLEAAELAKLLEDKWGVSAAAAAPSIMSGAAAEEVAQTEFELILSGFDAAKKIGVIKAVRAIDSSLSLKDAKDLVESSPKSVKSGLTKEDADKFKKAIEEAGGEAKLQ